MSHQEYRPRTLGGQAIAGSVNASRKRGWSFCPKKEAGVRFAAPDLELKDRRLLRHSQGDSRNRQLDGASLDVDDGALSGRTLGTYAGHYRPVTPPRVALKA